MARQQWLVFLPVTLATAGLAACASVLGGEQVKVRPIDTMQTLTAAPRDAFYESAVSAINQRDYGRALEYLQAAKAKDPRNVKALNALGVVYDKLGRFDLSARYYAQARAIEPDSRIVAENMGYSSILQRLINPNQSVAAATIDLPADLNRASPATPAAANKTVVAADIVPAMPVMPVTERKVIDAPPPSVAAAPFLLPDTKPLFASVILPEPVAPAVERRLIDTPSATMTAMLVELPDAKRLFADIALPEPVVPVTERKLIDMPPVTMTAMPVELPDAKRLFAEVVLPEPAMPVTEKKVIDAPPPTVTAAPFVLPDTRPLFTTSLSPAVLSLAGAERMAPAEPMASAATMTVALSSARRLADGPISPAPKPLLMAAVERQAMVETAPSAATAPAPTPTRPVIAAAHHAVSLPRAETKTAAAPVPAVPAKQVVVAAISAATAPAAPPAAKPAVVAPPRPIAAQPAKVTSEKTVASASVVKRPAVPVLPAKRMPAALVKQAAAKVAPAKGKVLTIGQPIKFVNASGKSGGAATVLRRLTTLGWTMRAADSRIQPATTLFYPVQNLAAAKALQRTLPFPVWLIADSGKAAGMRLVIGRDYLSWKPRNSRIAALWQKRTVIASSQQLSLRGVR